MVERRKKHSDGTNPRTEREQDLQQVKMFERVKVKLETESRSQKKKGFCIFTDSIK